MGDVAVEVSAGEIGDRPIDAFLNSQARRILAAYPQRAMVLACNRGADSWTTLGIADAEFDRVVRLVIEHADEWSPLETDNPQRLNAFARLLGHEDSRLHELAYLEIGRAPYGAVREIAERVSVQMVRAMLDDPRYLEWRSLAVLMLAQTRNPDDSARIRQTFDRKQRMRSTLNLAAWATAYIAVGGPAAIEHIEQIYLSRPDRSRDELREILQALSIQANDDAQLRSAIAAAYRTLIDAHPALASEITRDLITWRLWDFAEQVDRARTLIGEDDPLGTYALNLYLRMAAARADAAGGDQGAKTATSRADERVH